MKESKSMLEVWEWKDEVYNDTKDMSDEELLKYYRETADNLIAQRGLKKKKVGKNSYILVKAS
jgi:hypothetical protein